MKILFLDIDGVLNSKESLANKVQLIPNKVLMINNICKITDAKIVISSSWRTLFTIENLRSILKLVGLSNGEIIDYTPEHDNASRGTEIEKWLMENNHIENYVIIDDVDDFQPYQKKTLIQTDSDCGIGLDEMQKAINILS